MGLIVTILFTFSLFFYRGGTVGVSSVIIAFKRLTVVKHFNAQVFYCLC